MDMGKRKKRPLREKISRMALIVAIGLLLVGGQQIVRASESTSSAGYKPCSDLPGETAQGKCYDCMKSATAPKGFWTGVGCVPTTSTQEINQIYTFMLGIGGFFVTAQILIGAFEMVISKGNPQNLQKAKERVTNSVIALLFIFFSIAILQFVGVEVLRIPGFFEPPSTVGPDPHFEEGSF
jgi:hypothetical protein